MGTRINIPMSKILDYWKDKCITENGDVEIEYGYDGCDEDKLSKVDSIPVVYDWGEPSCFACNSYIPLELIDNYDDLLEQGNINKIWDNKNVSHYYQKAHIIPYSLGGKSEPSNLFCLCPECHRDSPDTVFSKEFFRFVYNRRKGGNKMYQLYQDVLSDIKQMDIPPAYILLASMNKEKDFNKYATTHGSVLQHSTQRSYLIGKAEMIYKKVKELEDIIGDSFLSEQIESFKGVITNN